jgi:two-component system, OmpR family, response regulator
MKIENILLIDDDENVLLIAQIGLEDMPDWRVHLAGSGVQGLELAKTVKPDVILLDMMMPGMDGGMVLAKLREDPDTAAIPVIFITGKVQSHDLDSYIALGVVGVLMKPFDPLALSQEILRMLTSHAANV